MLSVVALPTPCFISQINVDLHDVHVLHFDGEIALKSKLDSSANLLESTYTGPIGFKGGIKAGFQSK